MKKQNEELKNVSDYLSEFLCALRQFKTDYKSAVEEIPRCDSETQDLLHQLELGSYDARNRTATRIAHVRQRRRVCKDTVAQLQAIIDFINMPESVKFINQLNEILGKTRKAERNLENRVYFPRVVMDLEFVQEAKSEYKKKKK